jgi:4-amino-4-deoxy-L-arabinose transferase-like glycosyltransferase
LARDEPALKRAGGGRSSGTARRLVMCLIVFAIAFGVRLLSLHDTRDNVEKVQTVVAGDYKRVARLLRAGGIASFFNPDSPLADPNTLGHPPGYSILLALAYSTTGESDTNAQLINITVDSLAAVLIFLIVAELLPAAAGFIAGLLAAFSPQFAWNSVLLLPDTLALFQLLVAVYLLARAVKRPRLATVMAAGAMVGLSCWLRANALLLAPFMACACLLLFERGRRTSIGAALLAGALLVIAPLTIRNAIVFRHFIPLSLGAGQTFLEGIADYDREGRLGVPATDMGIMKWEAESYNRPDYYSTLFNPDGICRERMRLKRGLSIAASHPVWFLGVMARRAVSMLRLERARLISWQPPVTHTLEASNELQPVWAASAEQLKASGRMAAQAKLSLSEDNQTIELTGDDSMYGAQLLYAPVEIQSDTDYVLTLPVKILRGRMSIALKSADGVRTSTIVETEEMKTPEAQPERLIRLPFVTGKTESLQLVISNAASQETNPRIRLGAVRLYALGPASGTWTRLPRAVTHVIQKLYITAFMLPLAIFGLVLLVRRRDWRALVILMAVPVYYCSVQSATHTEYRYVLVIHYFLFAFAALFIYSLGIAARRRLIETRGL